VGGGRKNLGGGEKNPEPRDFTRFRRARGGFGGARRFAQGRAPANERAGGGLPGKAAPFLKIYAGGKPAWI